MKRNYLVLGVATLAVAGALLAQDQPAKTAPKKTASHGAAGSATRGKEVFEKKCSMCHFADSEAKKIGPGLKGISKRQARNVHRERRQGHHGGPDDVDRKWRLPDARHEGDAGARANQRRRRLRQDALTFFGGRRSAARFSSQFSIISSQFLVVGFPGTVLGREFQLTDSSSANIYFFD